MRQHSSFLRGVVIRQI